MHTFVNVYQYTALIAIEWQYPIVEFYQFYDGPVDVQI